jgi:DNA-binding MarR family transcriptional regulator
MKDELARELASGFSRVARKHQSLERKPLALPNGKTVYASEMHMAVAIGEGHASTGTELAALFGITKGAVSQELKKLEAKGLIQRTYMEGDGKTRVLSLTAEGEGIPALHERLHGRNVPIFEGMKKRYTAADMKVVIEFLKDAESLIDALLEDEK